MLMNRKNLLFFMFIASILSSCAPSYIPNKINAPLLTSIGEFKGSISTGTSGVDPQVAYALSNHLGLMINGSFASSNDTSEAYEKHQFVEIGAGYFANMGSPQFFYEIYGGMGYGKLESKEKNNLFNSRAKTNNTRLFVQSTIGYVSKNIECGVSNRFVAANLNESSSEKTCVFYEPALTCKLGFRLLKAVFQFGVSLPLTNVPSHEPFIASLGLEVQLGKKKSAKNN